MNDILSKPFSKQGLFDVIEKHLNHLRVIADMARSVPRGPGIPPMNDMNVQQALLQNLAAAQQLALPGPSTSTSDLALQPSSSTSSNPQDGAFNYSNFFGTLGLGQSEDEGKINPLSGMGMTDEQYGMMLQNMVSNDGLLLGFDSPGTSTATYASMSNVGGMRLGLGVKRSFEGDTDLDGPQGKKSRFEVIE